LPRITGHLISVRRTEPEHTSWSSYRHWFPSWQGANTHGIGTRERISVFLWARNCAVNCAANTQYTSLLRWRLFPSLPQDIYPPITCNYVLSQRFKKPLAAKTID
jgi:hypothetical protein